MVTRRIWLSDHRGRDAIVVLTSPPAKETVRYQDLDGRPVRPVRRIKLARDGWDSSADPDELARLLVDGDPEVDMELTGRETGPCDRVYRDGEGRAVYVPHFMEVRTKPDGREERRPLVSRPATIAAGRPLVWRGCVQRTGIVREFAFCRAYQVRHTNALEFDFLRSICEYLEERGAMARLGSGADGEGPLVLERGGTPYRGYLDGRTRGEAMRLVLYLTNGQYRLRSLPQ